MQRLTTVFLWQMGGIFSIYCVFFIVDGWNLLNILTTAWLMYSFHAHIHFRFMLIFIFVLCSYSFSFHAHIHFRFMLIFISRIHTVHLRQTFSIFKYFCVALLLYWNVCKTSNLVRILKHKDVYWQKKFKRFKRFKRFDHLFNFNQNNLKDLINTKSIN